MKWCYKFVYSPLPEDWLADATGHETHDPLFGHYGSLDEVMARARSAFDEKGERVNDIVDLVAAMKAGDKPDVVGI